MGLVAENTLVSIQGTKLKSEGPLLITHWGFSGPAVLKTSAFGARILSQKNYLPWVLFPYSFNSIKSKVSVPLLSRTILSNSSS